MEKQSKLGLNKTGMQMAPQEGPRTVEYAQERPPHPPVDEGEALRIRGEYIRESERVGSVPLPATAKGIATTAIDGLKGEPLPLLMDKLGQRTAFERTGTRLYEALIRKVEAVQPPQVDLMLTDLRTIRAEELSHFQMLVQVIRELGGDPTTQTPGADVSGVAALGLLQVITDPRTTLTQSLEAIQTAELTDTACWKLLIGLVDKTGHKKLAAPFRAAHEAETRHVETIKRWLETCMLEQI